ncbi:MAG TPA: aldehyde dehydrogenase family protein [Mycobacteriales bacterium]|nr:aldehyde dehydrogenase family protein [Mycobacteriales bacterium]
MTQLAEHGTIAIPEATTGQPATSLDDCDRAVADLAAQAKPWFDARPRELIPLLERLGDRVVEIGPEWVAALCDAQRIPVDQPLSAEEWSTPMAVGRYARLLVRSLTDIAAGRRPQPAGKPHPVGGGHTAVPVFPGEGIDKAVFSGFTAEVWLRRGVAAAQASERQAAAWFGEGTAGVSLVLGAGNQASIPVLDTLDRLFVARHPVILKMNPVNDYNGPIIAKLLAEFIDRGVVRIVYGGAEVGSHLVRHPDVADVHITGSDKTFEAIVFGGGKDGAKRKASRTPVVTKPVTGELGNVSPTIVVPGPWTAKDVAFQAQNITSMLTNNAGFNCIAMRALITWSGWKERDQLLGGVRDALRASADRYPYYPGARDRWDTFVAAHPEAERYGADGPGCVPWTMIPGLRPEADDDIAFTTEAFNGVFGEVGVDATDPVDFIRKAVAFANDTLWGTLGCSLIVHPASLKDPAVNRAVEQAVADLRYGTVAVNQWSALGYIIGSTPWGAYPGHPIDDVQSGIGFVHNSLMYADDDIEKTVVRGPFKSPIKPPWFPDNKTGHISSRLVAEIMAKPSWAKVPKLMLAAMRG